MLCSRRQAQQACCAAGGSLGSNQGSLQQQQAGAGAASCKAICFNEASQTAGDRQQRAPPAVLVIADERSIVISAQGGFARACRRVVVGAGCGCS